MKRRTLPAFAAAITAAALALTACGGGDGESSGSDKIAGAGSGDEKSSPSPSTTKDAAGRPEIKLPGDMKTVFEGRETGDAAKDAILADNEQTVSTVWKAMASGDTKTSGMAFYYTDTALTGAYEYAENAIDKSTSWAGTLRYYDRKVTVFDKKSAAVTYCVDESRADVKNRKTNKTEGTKTSSNSYVYYNTGVKKNEDGVWQTWSLSEDRGSEKCRP
ncbi:hypothetical protein ACWGII_22295 [Streptomyces sp. NPDC054855]